SEVGSPENTRDSMCVIEAFGMVKLSLRIHFVIAAKVGPDDDRSVLTEVWIRLDPIEQSADGGIRRSHHAPVLRKALMADIVRHLTADDHAWLISLQNGRNGPNGLNE